MAAGRKIGASKVAGDIKSLKIQGARRIAKAAVEALASAAKKSGAKNADELYSDLLVFADELASARETEPMLRNYLDELLAVVRGRRGEGVAAIKQMLAKRQDEIVMRMEASAKKIAAYGAALVPNKGAVLIHCHSTTLMMMLKMAYEEGKRPKVYCTETRPLYQGRISAVELANAGLDVTLIVDSAAGGLLAGSGKNEAAGGRGGGNAVGKIDVVFVGADAITARGELLNKVGTYPIALAAKAAGVKLFSAAELHKYDANTQGGRKEPVEIRGEGELADGKKMLLGMKAAGVKIINPAFDLTPPDLIGAYITEIGIVKPQDMRKVCEQTLRDLGPRPQADSKAAELALG